MTQHPEAVLCREAGLRYAAIALITDFDAGLEGTGIPAVTQDEVFAFFEANVETCAGSCSGRCRPTFPPPHRGRAAGSNADRSARRCDASVCSPGRVASVGRARLPRHAPFPWRCATVGRRPCSIPAAGCRSTSACCEIRPPSATGSWWPRWRCVLATGVGHVVGRAESTRARWGQTEAVQVRHPQRPRRGPARRRRRPRPGGPALVPDAALGELRRRGDRHRRLDAGPHPDQPPVDDPSAAAATASARSPSRWAMPRCRCGPATGSTCGPPWTRRSSPTAGRPPAVWPSAPGWSTSATRPPSCGRGARPGGRRGRGRGHRHDHVGWRRAEGGRRPIRRRPSGRRSRCRRAGRTAAARAPRGRSRRSRWCARSGTAAARRWRRSPPRTTRAWRRASGRRRPPSPPPTSFSENSPDSTTAGIDSRNENRAAASRVKPRNSPALMVEPERDTPGISASDCAKPIVTPSFAAMCSTSLVRLPVLSAHHRTRPQTIRVVAISRRSRAPVSIWSLNSEAEDGDRDRGHDQVPAHAGVVGRGRAPGSGRADRPTAATRRGTRPW